MNQYYAFPTLSDSIPTKICGDPKKLRLANFKIIDCYYYDCIGFFALLAIKIFGYKSKFKPGSDRSFELYGKYIYPIGKWLDVLGARFLFGKT